MSFLHKTMHFVREDLVVKMNSELKENDKLLLDIKIKGEGLRELIDSGVDVSVQNIEE